MDIYKAFGIIKEKRYGDIPQGKPILARLGEPQDVGQMQREHQGERKALEAMEQQYPGSHKHNEYMQMLEKYHKRLRETGDEVPFAEHIQNHKLANGFHGIKMHFPQQNANVDQIGQEEYYRPMPYTWFKHRFLNGADYYPVYEGADKEAGDNAIAELPGIHPDPKHTWTNLVNDHYDKFLANKPLQTHYAENPDAKAKPFDEYVNKLYKAFGIDKSPVKTLEDDYPDHNLFTSDCDEGFCFDNAWNTASAKQHTQLNPTIVHGAFPNGNHAWVEYDHPEYGKLVHDPTAGFAGSPQDMYEDPMKDSEHFKDRTGIHNGELIDSTHPLMEQPYLKPEVRYSLDEYKDMLRKHKHYGAFHDKANKRNERHYQGMPHDHTNPDS